MRVRRAVRGAWCRRTGCGCCISMLPSSGATLRPPRPSLRRLIAELALPARPTGELSEADVAPGPGTIARVAAAFAQAGKAPGAARGSRTPGRTARPPGRNARPGGTARRPGGTGARAAAQQPQIEVAGVAVGFALAAIVCVEMYVGVGLLALDGGHWLLAFGLSMDACARVLGAIAAGRCGSTRMDLVVCDRRKSRGGVVRALRGRGAAEHSSRRRSRPCWHCLRVAPSCSRWSGAVLGI